MNRLHQLAINDEGFVFDPTTGESFTVNSTGLTILRGIIAGQEPNVIAERLSETYEVATHDAERDVTDFVQRLRTYHLL